MPPVLVSIKRLISEIIKLIDRNTWGSIHLLFVAISKIRFIDIVLRSYSFVFLKFSKWCSQHSLLSTHVHKMLFHLHSILMKHIKYTLPNSNWVIYARM